MRKVFLIANFTDERSLLTAVKILRSEGCRAHDVFAPYPVHGLDEAMRIRKSRLPWIALLGGISGCILALSFQFYAAILDWPMNVGGKPDNSTLAFIPITFELTVLSAGLCTVAALLLRTGLVPGFRNPLMPEAVTEDRFAVALRIHSASEDRWSVHQLLERLGATEIYEKET